MSAETAAGFLTTELPRLTALRQKLHAMPELSRQEVETSKLVAAELRALGLVAHENIGGCGVVAEIAGKAEGPMVALRADMDALPIQEATGLGYASRHPGCMHACGHDGHTAAAAAYLAATRNFAGRVLLVFQPAEERYGGAQPMLDDGLIARFPFESIFSFHNWPGLAEGAVSVADGPVMAGSNEFEVVFRANGAHGAMPHLSADPNVTIAETEDGLRMADGTIYTVVRRSSYDENSLEAYRSTDLGRNWSYVGTPVPNTGFMGNPPALVAMPDGALVLLYGFRDAPFGLRAVVSCDSGQTWSEPLDLRDDGGDADLGYPRALVRQDGKIVVVYYFNDRNGPERFIAASILDAHI